MTWLTSNSKGSSLLTWVLDFRREYPALLELHNVGKCGKITVSVLTFLNIWAWNLLSIPTQTPTQGSYVNSLIKIIYFCDSCLFKHVLSIKVFSQIFLCNKIHEVWTVPATIFFLYTDVMWALQRTSREHNKGICQRCSYMERLHKVHILTA